MSEEQHDIAVVSCMLCGTEIDEPTAAPLCRICGNWNYLVHDEDGTYCAFSNEGRFHRSSTGAVPRNVTFIHGRRRRRRPTR